MIHGKSAVSAGSEPGISATFDMDLPPPDAYVMIIGAMKAGTTSLYRLLSRHPAVCPSRTKEPDFFKNAAKGRSEAPRYENFFAFDRNQHSVCLEASTSYSKFPTVIGVPERIAAYGLSPRFIYVVRDPFERIESHFNFANLRVKPWRQEVMLNPHSIMISMYHMQLREYLRHFPDKGRFQIVDFEMIHQQPASLAEDLFSWMGLPPHPVPAPEPSNVTPTKSMLEVRLQSSGLAWTKRLLPSSLLPYAKSLVRRITPGGRQSLSDDDRRLVHRWLRLDMARFGETFDFPVEKWGF